MSYETKYPNWKEKVIAASNTSKSASEAAAILDIKYDTYKKYAIKYGCFSTNPSGKGLNKVSGTKIRLEDILAGLHPQYQSNKLRLRLLEEGIFPHKCNNCELTEWLGNPIPLELLCPNCHSLTDTYRGKNKY